MSKHIDFCKEKKVLSHKIEASLLLLNKNATDYLNAWRKCKNSGDTKSHAIGSFMVSHKRLSELLNYSEAYIKNLTKEIFNKNFIKNSSKGGSGGILTSKSLKYLNSL